MSSKRIFEPETVLLISCVGRQYPLLEFFKTALGMSGRLIAVDCDPLAVGAIAAHVSYISPERKSSHYKEWLIDLFEKEKVTAVMTLCSDDLQFLERIRDEIHGRGIRLIGMPSSILEQVLDKSLYAELCEGTGLKILPHWDFADFIRIPDDRYPLLAKKKRGKGSRGLIRLDSKHQAKIKLLELKEAGEDIEYILQPCLQGQEYGIDLLNDLNSKNVAVFVRRKLRMRNGETDIAETTRDPHLEESAKILATRLGHQGLVDCDVIRTTVGDYLIDINPRFGGGYIFSHYAGANAPAALVAWLNSEEPKKDWLLPRTATRSARYTQVVNMIRSRQRLLVITSGGHDFGMGHAFRQFAIAREAKQHGHDVLILTQDKLVEDSAMVLNIPTKLTKGCSRGSLLPLIEAYSPTKIIVDVPERFFKGYRWLSEHWETILVVSRVGDDFEPFGSHVFYIGDNLEHWETEDRVFTPQGLVHVHAGRAFIFFRDEFRNIKPLEESNSQPTILIAHGGADKHGLTNRTLQALQNTKGVYEVTVLVGSAFKDVKIIKEKANASKHRCLLLFNETNVARRMRDATIAIINGGNVRYELCLTGTPFISISIQQSQIRFSEKMARLGAGRHLGLYTDVQDHEIATAAEAFIYDSSSRLEMRRKMEKLFDSRGIERFFHKLGMGVPFPEFDRSHA